MTILTNWDMFAPNLTLKKIGFQSFVYFMIMEKEFGIYTIHYNVVQRIQWGEGELLWRSVCVRESIPIWSVDKRLPRTQKLRSW